MTDTLLLGANEPLPPFDAIQADQVSPAIMTLIAQFERAIDELHTRGATPAEWLVTEERLSVEMDNAWAPVSQLHAVKPDEEWQTAYADNVAALTDFGVRMGQDQRRFNAYQSMASDPALKTEAEIRSLVEHALLGFRHAGVDLDADKQGRLGDINRRLSDLSTAFQRNLKDATDDWTLHLDRADRLAGLPAMAKSAAAERAADRDLDGYLITLEFPSYQAVVTYADDRSLREQVYQAYCTRASDQSGRQDWDNGPVIHEILSLRQEMAELLGYSTYADFSLADKMADSPAQVHEFLDQLLEIARPRAVGELEQLQQFARESGLDEELAAWDLGYYSEKLKAARYQVDDEEVRPYFAAEACVDGVISVAEQVFGIKFQANDAMPVWHESVRYFDMVDSDGSLIAGIYMDLYSRRGKRGGAWMGDCRSRARIDGLQQRPVAYLNCNFPPPGADRPSLLNHDELTTLFHEFGHCLHHVLTEVDWPSVAGISGVEWDAVELPSQIFENWCWEKSALDRFARHYETGDPLPLDLFDRMVASRHFQSGLFLVRQLEFALTDMAMHSQFDSAIDNHAQALWNATRERTAVMEVPEYNRFLNGFGHLFAGGYAAGYYSYLWAEQLAADAFARFREEGVFNATVGEDFRRAVLAVGSSRPAATSFAEFRGREPMVEPLLVSYGLIERGAA